MGVLFIMQHHALIEFITSQWKKEEYKSKIGNKEFYVTENYVVYTVSYLGVNEECDMRSKS
jgi:hypothetical protein